MSDYSTIDLGGEWRFAWADEAPGGVATAEELAAAGLALHPCTVPGNFELDLQALGLVDEPYFGLNILGLRRFERAQAWYVRRFTADAPADSVQELVFEGIDCFAEIYLNGEHLGSTDNMLISWTFDVTGRLRAENELLVHLRPAVAEAKRYAYPPSVAAFRTNFESLYVRKAPHMYGWDIMPRAVSLGLWRPVSLRCRPVERLEEAYLQTERLSADGRQAAQMLNYRVHTAGKPEDIYELQVDGAHGDSSFSQRIRLLFDAGRHQFTVENPHLWWPNGYGEAALYDVVVTLLKNGTPLDRMTFRHGIRTATLERTDVTNAEGDGEFCFIVNGERIFAKGTNWVPADVYHSRDRARIPAILEMAHETHCNIIRCWGGNVYEDEIFYQRCDELGIMIWQDFAMACAVYPQDADFQARLAQEARVTIKRLRQHPCLVLWAGDNECDCTYGWFNQGDPNRNVLTRQVLPEVLRQEDPARSFLPSSPYISPAAYRSAGGRMPEDHLWGPRGYFKSDFYTQATCHFVSEIGYHGCPEPASIRRFISPEKVWPYQNNEEWNLHSTSPSPEAAIFGMQDSRVQLMANQIRCLFGKVPGTLEEFAFASQATQAEAKKFFIEWFRGGKWRRTGIIWWNLMDGWPQFSDAVVDYYFAKKLAYYFITRSQQHLCVLLREPTDGRQQVVAVNDTREDYPLSFTVRDQDSGEILAEGRATARANQATVLADIPVDTQQRFILLAWESALGQGSNHYLAGAPPFNLRQYRAWLEGAGLLPAIWAGEQG